MPKFAALLCFVAAFAFSVAAASALPVFAHRYGFSCQQCHTTVPQLNEFGEQFRRRGFRLPGARPALPVAVKVATAYSSAADPSGLPKAVVDEIELLSAGALGRKTSYFAEQYVLDGGVPGRPRDLWIQYDADENGVDGLHLRAGQFTLPLPVDPETQRPTLAHYEIFDQSVGANGFAFFDPRVGIDVSFSSQARGTEVHAVAVRAAERASGIPAAGLDLMGAAQQRIGQNTTAFVYAYRGQRALSPVHDQFARYGYALFSSQGKFDATVLAGRGWDRSSDGFGTGATSSGGFAQTAWHASTALTLYARYDATFDSLSGGNRATTLSLVMRPRRNMRFTVEASHSSDRRDTLGAGLLFAY